MARRRANDARCTVYELLEQGAIGDRRSRTVSRVIIDRRDLVSARGDIVTGEIAGADESAPPHGS